MKLLPVLFLTIGTCLWFNIAAKAMDPCTASATMKDFKASDKGEGPYERDRFRSVEPTDVAGFVLFYGNFTNDPTCMWDFNARTESFVGKPRQVFVEGDGFYPATNEKLRYIFNNAQDEVTVMTNEGNKLYYKLNPEDMVDPDEL